MSIDAHAGPVHRSAGDERVSVDVSVIMPCLNEEESLEGCIREAFAAMESMEVTGEVIVVDNGSTDSSVEVATSAGARVVVEDNLGYGSACRRGLREAEGRYLVLGDADGTYDFGLLDQFVGPLKNGSDLVLGNRLIRDLDAEVMPWLHRVGNPFLTGVINGLFDLNVADAHCGLRSISKEAHGALELRTTGMEFASEFLIEARRNSLRVSQVPIRYRQRSGGEPKLRTFRDGWRHLSFMVGRAMRSTERSAGRAGALFARQSPVDDAVRERA